MIWQNNVSNKENQIQKLYNQQQNGGSTSEFSVQNVIEQLKNQYLAIAVSLLITFLNSISYFIIIFLTNSEKQWTRTLYNISAIKKLAFVQFMISALITFIIDLLVLSPEESKFSKIFGSGGLIYNQNFVLIMNSIIPFLNELIDIPWIYRNWERKYLVNLVDKGYPILYTQTELNNIFEEPEFDIVKRYSDCLQSMYLCAFYSPILPVGMIWSILGIFLHYWIDKYNLLRRRVIKYNMSSDLSREMIEMLEFVLIIYCTGNLIFWIFILEDQEDKSCSIWSILGVVVGVLHAALPMEKVSEFLCKVKNAPFNEQSYQEVELDFLTDYARENPATKKTATESFLKKIEQMKEKEYQQKKQEYMQKQFQKFNEQLQNKNSNRDLQILQINNINKNIIKSRKMFELMNIDPDAYSYDILNSENNYKNSDTSISQRIKPPKLYNKQKNQSQDSGQVQEQSLIGPKTIHKNQRSISFKDDYIQMTNEGTNYGDQKYNSLNTTLYQNDVTIIDDLYYMNKYEEYQENEENELQKNKEQKEISKNSAQKEKIYKKYIGSQDPEQVLDNILEPNQENYMKLFGFKFKYFCLNCKNQFGPIQVFLRFENPNPGDFKIFYSRKNNAPNMFSSDGEITNQIFKIQTGNTKEIFTNDYIFFSMYCLQDNNLVIKFNFSSGQKKYSLDQNFMKSKLKQDNEVNYSQHDITSVATSAQKFKNILNSMSQLQLQSEYERIQKKRRKNHKSNMIKQNKEQIILHQTLVDENEENFKSTCYMQLLKQQQYDLNREKEIVVQKKKQEISDLKTQEIINKVQVKEIIKDFNKYQKLKYIKLTKKNIYAAYWLSILKTAILAKKIRDAFVLQKQRMKVIRDMIFVLKGPFIRYKRRSHKLGFDPEHRSLHYVNSGLQLQANFYKGKIIAQVENQLVNFMQDYREQGLIFNKMGNYYKTIVMVQNFWKNYMTKVKNYKKIFCKEFEKAFYVLYPKIIGFNSKDTTKQQELLKMYSRYDVKDKISESFFRNKVAQYRQQMKGYLEFKRSFTKLELLQIFSTSAFVFRPEEEQSFQQRLQRGSIDVQVQQMKKMQEKLHQKDQENSENQQDNKSNQFQDYQEAINRAQKILQAYKNKEEPKSEFSIIQPRLFKVIEILDIEKGIIEATNYLKEVNNEIKEEIYIISEKIQQQKEEEAKRQAEILEQQQLKEKNQKGEQKKKKRKKQ
ncbi:hypothetical protein PPERSA_04336 [Pseudocohnilembus persalinus]|uniref:Uncharacterized protein n=1 Tax=Pseudocohnilembus persalinus TaxID=266149 RepID=A0A0V0QQG2_PSEPJ|nr:hypothetical protein PPERSA_04336 [Pseudocohnilembus persalinus]|eukprot:KRX04521.1 hypothetical protein PPERSA_04336 [Pseudocohnilembus persalinus]